MGRLRCLDEHLWRTRARPSLRGEDQFLVRDPCLDFAVNACRHLDVRKTGSLLWRDAFVVSGVDLRLIGPRAWVADVCCCSSESRAFPWTIA